MINQKLLFKSEFKVGIGNQDSQAAEMVLKPGAAEGGSGNRHAESDQWLYVVLGTGEAIVEGKTISLGKGTIVLIERGNAHEIRNTGRTPLKTLNIYVPPAYTENGKELEFPDL